MIGRTVPSTGTGCTGHITTTYISLPITLASLACDGTFRSRLQGMEHPHHNATPGRTAQTINQQSVLVKVLPVHGNATLALRAQARQVQLLSLQRPRQGAFIDACAFGRHARHRQCVLQALSSTVNIHQRSNTCVHVMKLEQVFRRDVPVAGQL